MPSIEQTVYEAAIRWYRALHTLSAEAELVERAKLADVLADVWRQRA